MGLIQRNTDEGRCLLESPSEILTKADLLFLLLNPAAQVLWLAGMLLCLAVVGYTDKACCTVKEGLNESWVKNAVVRCCCILLLRIYWLG